MIPSRIKFVLIALVALTVSLPCAPAAWGGQGSSNNTPPNNGSNGQSRGQGRAYGKRKGATQKAMGPYHIKIAGYYTGGGTADATSSVSIRAEVTDPRGNTSTLQASGLDVVNNRFRGKGTLAGRDVEIVGRLDEHDEATDEKKVLKKSRITFTFRDGTRYGRGAGERTAEPQPAN